jgi:ABC-type bacteriocin/lantibiotic exporter with double-glycine peptidase domain
LLDDSLSAVDAHVGKAILENLFLRGPFSDKTRILVTHALHVLDKTDYIYVMEDGVIIEQGTYAVSHLQKYMLVSVPDRLRTR